MIVGAGVLGTAGIRSISDWQANDAMHRICERAGLPHHGFHRLRHSFGTHAARLAVNPWRLQRWMGHKRLEETELYVNLVQIHPRETPPLMLAARETERDPDRKILAMLSARGSLVAANTDSE